jgi:hypothetical protein
MRASLVRGGFGAAHRWVDRMRITGIWRHRVERAGGVGRAPALAIDCSCSLGWSVDRPGGPAGRRDRYMCPPSADCVAPVDPPLADAAAFDPSTGTWRTVASAPVAFSWASTAVLGDDVYFLVPPESRRPQSETTFLRYSIAADAWAQLPGPTVGRSWYSILAAGEVIVAWAGSDEWGREPLQRFDPVGQNWKELPAAPLSPAFDRVLTWSGTHLYVFDHELVPSPGSERPPLTRAARLDLSSRAWERLPDSEILGTRTVVCGCHVLGDAHVGKRGRWRGQ